MFAHDCSLKKMISTVCIYQVQQIIHKEQHLVLFAQHFPKWWNSICYFLRRRYCESGAKISNSPRCVHFTKSSIKYGKPTMWVISLWVKLKTCLFVSKIPHYLWANHMKGLLCMDTSDLQRFCPRDVAQQTAGLKTHRCIDMDQFFYRW